MTPKTTRGCMFSAVYGFCEKNRLKFSSKTGRHPILSFANILTMSIFWQVSRIKDFKSFYYGPVRPILEKFFPKLPEYPSVMKRLPKIWGVLRNIFSGNRADGKFIIDSTPMRLCLPIRIKRFKTMLEAMGKAVSSTKITFEFKVYTVTDEKGRKAINFCFSNGSEADVCSFEIFLENCTGTAIGDSGYVSKVRKNRLMENELRFIAKRRKI